jgi:hypothetical protein
MGIMIKPTLLTQSAYAAHREAHGLAGGRTQSAVSHAIKAGRISYEPGTRLIDPAKADLGWAERTEPRPQFQASSAPSTFAARQAEPVSPADVLQALHDAYGFITTEYQALCSGFIERTEPMTVRDLDRLMDEVYDRLDKALVPCIHLAFTGDRGSENVCGVDDSRRTNHAMKTSRTNKH